jgi:formylglycine-generating enzyme required for sulfatase activity
MATEKRPLKVFLCHAHSDAATVRALYLRLRREGVDVWLDKEKLLPGSDWEYEIRKAVRESDVVVVCLSKQFNQAGFRQKEVRIALDTAMEKPEGEIFIIPARLEECENLESLSKWHWVDLFETDGYQKLIRALRMRADRIGATLRIRRGGQSTISRPKNNEPEKTTEPSTSNANVGSVVVPETWETQNFEKTEDEAVEKGSLEQEEREKAEKVEQEKRDALVKAKRERAERRAVQIAAIKETFSKSFNQFKLAIPKAKPFLRIGGILGIIFILFWVGSWAISKFPPILTETLIPTKVSTPTAYKGSLQFQINAAKDVTMVLVPEGEFIMGSDAGLNGEEPSHQVILPAYYIDKYEVTDFQYKRCADDGLCGRPDNTDENNGNYPVVYVTWYMAKAYCEWRGDAARLPTEAEWEKAARGPNGRVFPWGDGIDKTYANYNNHIGSRQLIGHYDPKGNSFYSATDMAGNVWEWVADWYSETYYMTYLKNQWPPNPKGPDSGQDRVIRGGSWNSISTWELYTYYRNKLDPTSVRNDVGFRCARNANP